MSKLYARVFAKILESSIADDWQVRMVFQDFLLLAEDGTVDMTRQAIARRTNVPLEIVERAISVLEEPDPRSRDRENDGRRIVRLDPHRDWGWQVTNWEKYESVRCQNETREVRATRMRHYRERKAAAHPNPEPPPAPPPKDKDVDVEVDIDIDRAPTRSTTGSATKDTTNKPEPAPSGDVLKKRKPVGVNQRPTEGEAELHASKIGLPMSEVPGFFAYYDSIDWVVGKGRVPMTNWRASMTGWKRRYEERRNKERAAGTSPHRVDMEDPAEVTALERRERIMMFSDNPWEICNKE